MEDDDLRLRVSLERVSERPLGRLGLVHRDEDAFDHTSTTVALGINVGTVERGLEPRVFRYG
ncbi:hypothetical protein GCM10009000_025540 [Halobacterium noricense]